MDNDVMKIKTSSNFTYIKPRQLLGIIEPIDRDPVSNPNENSKISLITKNVVIHLSFDTPEEAEKIKKKILDRF